MEQPGQTDTIKDQDIIKDCSKDIINEALEKGDAVFYLITDDPMIACKYWSAKDKASGQRKVVYMLLTCHQPIMFDIANRRKGEPIVQKPYAVNLIQCNLYGWCGPSWPAMLQCMYSLQNM